MEWPRTPYLLPLLGVAALCTALGFRVWRRHTVPGRVAGTVMLFAVAIWTFSYGLELEGSGLEAKVIAAKLQYLGIVVTPLSWLAFILDYTGRAGWFTRPRLAILAVVPTLTALLVWTNELHGLVWSRVALDATAAVPALVVDHGSWFWVHLAHSYLLLLVGSIVVVWTVIRSPGLYRAQAGSLLVAAVLPWLGNAIYLAGLSPIPNLDLTPFGFALTGLIMVWSLMRLRFFDLMLGIVPVARGAIVESMRDGYVVLDRAGLIVDLNPAALQIIGLPSATVVGQPAAKVFASWPDGPAGQDDAAEQQLELTLGEDVEQRSYDLLITPLYFGSSILVGRLLVLRDITDRKRAEEERARLFALERAARAEAELAVRAREQFLATAAHELKTPVAIVRGYAQLLSAYGHVERQARERQALEAIQRGCDRLARRVDELLTVSRLASGRLELERERFDLRELVLQTVQQFETVSTRHRFLVQIEAGACILGSRDRIEQVLVNLLNNAVKFSPAGGDIATRVSVRSGAALVTVQDHGIGIPADRQARVFEQFYQAHAGSSHEYGGMGIGLHLSREFVTLHGGSMWFSSVEGQGSTFGFSLPLADECVEEQARPDG